MSKPSRRGHDPRQYLKAYLRSQDLHRAIHKLTKLFESDSSDAEITRQLAESQALLNQILELLQ